MRKVGNVILLLLLLVGCNTKEKPQDENLDISIFEEGPADLVLPPTEESEKNSPSQETEGEVNVLSILADSINRKLPRRMNEMLVWRNVVYSNGEYAMNFEITDFGRKHISDNVLKSKFNSKLELLRDGLIRRIRSRNKMYKAFVCTETDIVYNYYRKGKLIARQKVNYTEF